MKKIIAMAVTAVLLLSATFALDFEVGARGILGRNLDSGSFADNYKAAKEDKTFDFGFGAYANFALFGGLGIQAEANYVNSSMTFVKDGADTVKYSMHLLDLSPMVWLNLDLWRFTIGFGAGPNFEIPLASLGDIKDAKKQDFTLEQYDGESMTFLLKEDELTVKSYPYSFELRVRFSLLENGFLAEHCVKNTGKDRMYFSLGAHPGFQCQMGDRIVMDEPETEEAFRFDENALRAISYMLVLYSLLVCMILIQSHKYSTLLSLRNVTACICFRLNFLNERSERLLV